MNITGRIGPHQYLIAISDESGKFVGGIRIEQSTLIAEGDMDETCRRLFELLVSPLQHIIREREKYLGGNKEVSREAFEKWCNENPGYTYYDVWQAAHARYAGSGEASATAGMNLGERISHVGGRENEQGYVEFGSPMAVKALIDHVLRDITHPTAQPKVPDELTGEQWSAMRKVIAEYVDKIQYAMHSEIESAYLDEAPKAVYAAMLSAQEQETK